MQAWGYLELKVTRRWKKERKKEKGRLQDTARDDSVVSLTREVQFLIAAYFCFFVLWYDLCSHKRRRLMM